MACPFLSSIPSSLFLHYSPFISVSPSLHFSPSLYTSIPLLFFFTFHQHHLSFLLPSVLNFLSSWGQLFFFAFRSFTLPPSSFPLSTAPPSSSFILSSHILTFISFSPFHLLFSVSSPLSPSLHPSLSFLISFPLLRNTVPASPHLVPATLPAAPRLSPGSCACLCILIGLWRVGHGTPVNKRPCNEA